MISPEILPPAIMEAMTTLRPRCCMADTATGSANRWAHKPVLFTHSLDLGALTPEQCRLAYSEAAGNWNAVCGVGLEFLGTPGNGNINAKSGRIDGRSGTLAWSYLPGVNEPASSKLQQLFDDSESWSYNWLVEVICHELGHAIGLSHSGDKLALMYPYSHGGLNTRPQTWDIAEAVARYGNVSEPNPPPGIPDIGGVIVVGGISYAIRGVAS